MNRICKSFTFEAAHQLENAFTQACFKCIHGHSYTVEMYLVSRSLNKDEMVLDFGELSDFKAQVMGKWDHGLILHEDKKQYYQPLIDLGLLDAKKVSFLDKNPTAETMARILYAELSTYVKDLLLSKMGQAWARVQVEKVRVHETSTGWAEYQGELIK